MRAVRVCLGALTRVEYTCLVEVPDNATDEQIMDMADKIYDRTDGEEYVDDPHFWERGMTQINDDESGDDCRIEFIATPDPENNGDLDIEWIPAEEG